MEAEKHICVLCGFGTGKNPVRKTIDNTELEFCCKGCEFVYDIFVSSGKFSPDTFRQSDLFKKYVESGFLQIPELTENKEKIELPVSPESSEQINLRVDGMWCAVCANMIDYVLSGTDGIMSSSTNFASDTTTITYSPYYISKTDIIKKINDLGYKAFDFADEGKIKKERRTLTFRVGLAAALSINIMMLNIVFYPGVAHTISSDESMMLSMLLLLFTTPLIFIIGLPVLKKAATDIRYLYPGMEVLVSIGILTSYFYSVYVMLTDPNGELYFDTAGNLMALILIGKFIETNARMKASESLSVLYKSIPTKIRLVKDGIEKFISIKEAMGGDVFIVKEGEMVPIDGVVLSGEADFDEAMLTGESRSIRKTIGENVFSGSILKSGYIKASVLNDSESSILNNIIKSVESSLTNKPKIQQLTDRMALYFTPSILLIAIATLAANYWLMNHGFGESLIRSISVIVIACPCAMAISVPLAIVLSVSSLARKGIIVKSSDLFELKEKKSALVFDKTGTVTEGEFTLLGYKNISSFSDEEFLGLIFSAEERSSHTIARELVRKLKEKKIITVSLDRVKTEQGKGIEFEYKNNLYRIGRYDFCTSEEKPVDAAVEIPEEATTIYFSENGVILGFLWLGDAVKPSAVKLFKELKSENHITHLISGDDEKVVFTVAEKLSINHYRGGMLPQDKIKYIHELSESGYRVIMVGDGVNDAPSLAAADIGIAVNSGSDLAKTSASVNLLDDNIGKISFLLQTISKSKKIMRENLVWALGYNVIAIYFAVSGALNPFIAVTAMIISSLSVTINSLRLKVK